MTSNWASGWLKVNPKNRDLAKKLRKGIGVDPSDCRIIQIYCDHLCEAIEAAEILETALDYYINTPAARLERVLGD